MWLEVMCLDEVVMITIRYISILIALNHKRRSIQTMALYVLDVGDGGEAVGELDLSPRILVTPANLLRQQEKWTRERPLYDRYVRS
jgi:hypothetical protein